MRFSQSTHLLMCLSLITFTSIIRIGQPVLVELIDLVNSVIIFLSHNLTQMVNFPTRIADCDSHNPAPLDLILYTDASICSALAFPPLENSDHVDVSASIDFLSNSKRDVLFYRIAYDYSRVDWGGLRGNLRDITLVFSCLCCCESS